MNKKLFLCWAGLDFLFLVATVLCFVFVFAWRGFGAADLDSSPGLYLRRLTVTVKDAWAAIALGSLMAITFLYSLAAVAITRKPNQKTTHLTILNYLIGLALLATLAIGTAIWVYSLRQRVEFERIWMDTSTEGQGVIQDFLQCCGYWNASSTGLFTASTGFCGTAAIATNATLATPCVTPMTRYSDNTLNNIFSTVYGISVVQVSLFMATACLRVNKMEEERFRKIDEKRGTKGGFV